MTVPASPTSPKSPPTGPTVEAAVLQAIASVEDPEYPGVSVVELGLLERLDVDRAGAVEVGLIPTFSGCPALAMIAADVEAAVGAVAGVTSVEVRWLPGPAWTPERIDDGAKAVLADRFTVAVQIGAAPPACPRCGGPTEERSLFGPSRCRAVNRCTSCAETVEVIRA